MPRDMILQAAAGATGDGEVMEVSGFSSVAFQISGTFVGTVTFEATVDASNWFAVPGLNVVTRAIVTTMSVPGIVQVPCAGYASVRARVSAWTSGTIRVEALASENAGNLNAVDQAITVADGADVAVGATADAAVETDATGTVSGKLRGLVKLFVNFLSRLPAALAAGGGLKVEGVAGGVAQPISAAALPLPTGAATSALQGGGLPAALGAGGGLKVA